MVKKLRDAFVERRRYIRLLSPISVAYTVPETGSVHSTSYKNVSADGLRIETTDRELKESGMVELKLSIVGAPNPVHARGRVIWKKKMSLEDNAPFDCGIEFTEIEEDNKNTFLKFLCDLIYDIRKEARHQRRKE